MSKHYKYHLAVYSKIIEGHDPSGPIRRGSEARVNGMTADFPTYLIPFCRPTQFFDGEPLITEMDPEIVHGGAFVYYPAKIEGTHYSIFARIEARSEAGESEPGRKYTHAAMIFVANHWEAGLIPWAAEMLFTFRHGGRCWGNPVTEFDETRECLPVPPLASNLPYDAPNGGPLAAPCEGLPPPLRLRGRLSTAYEGIEGEAHPYVALGAQVAAMLEEYDYSIAGRWLSLGMGVGTGATGLGSKGFFVRLDMRDADELNEMDLPTFDDFNPAKRFLPVSTMGQSPFLDWAELHGPNRDGPRYEFLLSDDILWDFQRDYIDQHGLDIGLAAPHPEPLAELAEAPEQFHHPARMTETRQAFSWPELQLPPPPFLEDYDEEFDDTSYASVLDPIRVSKIRPALQQIIRRCQILDPLAGYDTLDLRPDYDKLVEAVQALVEWSCSYMVLAQPKHLYEVMEDLFTHPEIESIELPGASRGGVLQQLYCVTIGALGRDRVITWMEDQYRYESSRLPGMRRKGLVQGNYVVHKTDRRQVVAFFDWLEEPPQLGPRRDCNLVAIYDLAQDVAARIAERWGLNDDVGDD